MQTFDLTPLYRNSVGFDHLASLLNSASRANAGSSYPPYNIEVLGENKYAITLSVAGFSQADLEINVERNVLLIRGKKAEVKEAQYLHQGIANRAFERKFNLADHVEVKSADLAHGLLTVNLEREIPEAMKPRSIAIGDGFNHVRAQQTANQNNLDNPHKIA